MVVTTTVGYLLGFHYDLLLLLLMLLLVSGDGGVDKHGICLRGGHRHSGSECGMSIPMMGLICGDLWCCFLV